MAPSEPWPLSRLIASGLLDDEAEAGVPEEDNDHGDSDLDILEFMAIATICSQLAIAQQATIRAAARTSLRRADLPKNPRYDTAWQALYLNGNDDAFITTTGFDGSTFRAVLQAGFEQGWNWQQIGRVDTEGSCGIPRAARRSLDAAGALGLVLHYLTSPMKAKSLQQIFGIVPSTVSRYLHFGLALYLDILQKMDDAQIVWPGEDRSRLRRYVEQIHRKYPLLEGAFGFVDGLKVLVATSGDEVVQQANYNGWLHSHYVSNILTFAPDGSLLFAQLNAPGSWHDASVASTLLDLLRNKTLDGYYLLADTAFPRYKGSKIRTPIKEGDNLPRENEARRAAIKMSAQVTSARQAAEWGMRAIQGTYGRLKVPLDANNKRWRLLVLEAVCRSYQLRVSRVGLNQIRRVYTPDEEDRIDPLLIECYRLVVDEPHSDRLAKFYHLDLEL